jgi:hypothetical protein
MYNIVKHHYIKYSDGATGRARAHARYIQHRPGKDLEGAEYRKFFSDRQDKVSYRHIFERFDQQAGHGVLIHKLILGPAYERTDLTDYTREVMSEIGRFKGLNLEWYAVEHHNTDHPHCHVIVLGRDTNGRPVYFGKTDYEKARGAGDAYLTRCHDVRKLREWRDKDSLLEKARKALREAVSKARDLLGLKTADREKEWRLQDLPLTGRGGGLGDLPSTEELAARAAKKGRLAEIRSRRRWQEYACPIRVDYGQDADEPVSYTWRSNLDALRELRYDYLSGDAFVRKSLSPQDFNRLELWIKHRTQDQRKLQQQAELIEHIKLRYDDGDDLIINRKSPVDHLKGLQHLHERADVFLQEHECLALQNWIARAEEQRPRDYRQPSEEKTFPDRELDQETVLDKIEKTSKLPESRDPLRDIEPDRSIKAVSPPQRIRKWQKIKRQRRREDCELRDK